MLHKIMQKLNLVVDYREQKSRIRGKTKEWNGWLAFKEKQEDIVKWSRH